MKSTAETIYLKCPVLIQNLLLTLYGYRIQKERYSGLYKTYFQEVNRHLQYGSDELDKYINSTFTSMIRMAAETVPYYRKLFQRYMISPNDIKSVGDLAAIPLLDKHSLRSNPDAFISNRYQKQKLLCIHTTGTTGTPLRIYCDNAVRQRNYAFYNRFLSGNDIQPTGKRATLGGRIIVPPDQTKPPFWRYSYLQKNILFSSYHLSPANLRYYIDALLKLKPDYIDSYPSSLYCIAEYAVRKKVDLNGVTLGITTSAETLFTDQRELIESVFGVPVCDQYGAAEMCVFVGQCPQGQYHIHSDYGIVEFLRENGKPADPGEEAEIVCTGLINPVMPLIRYRIGDRGILSEKRCKCGSHFPVLDKLLGRDDDLIITPEGNKVGRLSPVLKGFPIKETQYIQEDRGSVTVLLVKDVGYAEKDEGSVIAEIRKRLGFEIDINIKYVADIPRGAGGKLKTVISKIRY